MAKVKDLFVSQWQSQLFYKSDCGKKKIPTTPQNSLE